MKKIFVLIYFFGGILLSICLLFLGVYLAPSEFIQNREAIKNPDNLLPNIKLKKAFDYLGTLTAIEGFGG